MTTESQSVTLRGVTFAYSDEGSGPVVLRAHGLSQSRAGEQAAPLYDFGPVATAGFRLITYDARGHGESTGTPESVDYLWSNLAEDMLALADHFSPGEPVDAIGTSMGTGTILHAVLQRPDRFRRIVLTAPPTAWDTRAGQAAMYEGLAKLVEQSAPEKIARLFAAAPIAPIFADVPGFPPAPSVAPELLPTVMRGAGMTDLPDPNYLRGITQPTLLLPWATDSGHPLSTAEKLHELIPSSELWVANTSADIATWGTRAAEFLSR
jgi:3-oxoadipate enol-lactonase